MGENDYSLRLQRQVADVYCPNRITDADGRVICLERIGQRQASGCSRSLAGAVDTVGPSKMGVVAFYAALNEDSKV